MCVCGEANAAGFARAWINIEDIPKSVASSRVTVA